MASERQRAANRRNGSKGGPSTEAGKQRSRLNTIKHGLTSTMLVVLPEEHQHEYQEVLRGFHESFQPQGAAEEALVLQASQVIPIGIRTSVFSIVGTRFMDRLCAWLASSRHVRMCCTASFPTVSTVGFRDGCWTRITAPRYTAVTQRSH